MRSGGPFNAQAWFPACRQTWPGQAAIGRAAGLPVTSIDPDDVPGHFGWIGTFFAMDLAATSTVTRELLGWVPVGPALIEDIDTGGYSPRTPADG